MMSMWGRLLLMAVLSFSVPAYAAQRVATPASDFTAYLLDGSKVSLADLRGKVIVVNLWASWCGPCKQEMPMMDAMQDKLAVHGLYIVGVLTNDPIPAYRFKKLAGVLHYPIAARLRGDYPPIGGGLPTNYIIDRKGIVRYAASGSMDANSFAAVIAPLLQEAP